MIVDTVGATGAVLAEPETGPQPDAATANNATTINNENRDIDKRREREGDLQSAGEKHHGSTVRYNTAPSASRLIEPG
jgi:hypothetical protein